MGARALEVPAQWYAPTDVAVMIMIRIPEAV
jgi:hypothetical protein